MAVSIVIFWYVGWQIAGPPDAESPVSLMMTNQGVMVMAELLGLAIIAGGLAVAICGAGSADRGPLAVAIGLAAMAVRGAQLDKMVLYRMSAPIGDAASDPFPTWELMAECWLWLALIAVGFVVGRWVAGWFGPSQSAQPANQPPADHSPDVRQSLGTIATTAIVAWIVISFTVGNEANAILKGQVYFSIGLSFLIGALISHWLFRARSRISALVAVAIVACFAYVVFGPDAKAIAAATDAGTYLNIRPPARPLPIEFAAMGAVGVLLETDAMHMVRSMFGVEGTRGPGD